MVVMRFWCLAIAALVAFSTTTLHAAVFDPKLKFETIETEHFKIHFPGELKTDASRLSAIAEEVHATLSPKLKWKPWGRTEVVLLDSADRANGVASLLPYNHILLYLTPPRGDSALLNYRDYLTMLFTHEYTHILHMDAYDGIATPFHWIFGKVVAPSAASPGWVREGWATFQESDETGYGRGHSAYTDMVIRTDLLDGKFLPIDRADGVQIHWPGSSSQYLYGTRFWQWLEDTYGADKVDRFHDSSRQDIVLFAINGDAHKAFGKTFPKLWKDWQQSLALDLDTLRKEVGETTPTTPFIEARQARHLAWAPNGSDYAVALDSIDDGDFIAVYKNGSEDKKLRRRAKVSGQLAFSPDGKSIFYSAYSEGRYKAPSYLYRYDLETRKAKPLKGSDGKALRGFDPDIAKDGKAIVYVCRRVGREELCLYDLDTQAVTELTASEENPTYTLQYFNPRFSPDGKQIAFVRGRDGRFELLTSTREKNRSHIAITSPQHILSPTWSADGKQLAFSSDQTGIYNLYSISLATQETRRLTNTLTGIFAPSYRPDGSLYAQVYTEKGFEFDRIDRTTALSVERNVWQKRRDPEVLKPSPSESAKRDPVESKPYTPLSGSLVTPRYVMPLWSLNDSDFLLGLTTGSHDPLYRHLWDATLHYRSGPEYVGGSFGYTYNRFAPFFYTNFYRYSVNFGDIFGVGEDFYESRWRALGGVGYYAKGNLIRGSYFFEDREPHNLQDQRTDLLNLGYYSGFHFDYTFAFLQKFPNSISPEKGPYLNLNYDITDDMLGSDDDNEQQIFVGDFRYFYELPWFDHHVLAMRATGGISFGDDFVQRTFALGGDIGESPLSRVSRRTFSLRGVPLSDISGERALVFSLEYRVPLVDIERGFGTAPNFLNKLHLAFFSDYGDIFDKNVRDRDNKAFFDDFMLGIGAELRGDFVIGHGLPLTGRLGYGIIVVNRDRVDGRDEDTFGSNAKYGTLILQVGTSF